MKKYLNYILLFACILTSFCLSANNKNIVRYIKGLHSFDFKNKDESWKFTKIDITPYSYKRDTVEYINPGNQDLWINDSFINSLLSLDPKTVYQKKQDSTLAYYKVISSDSVLSFKFAFYGYELNSKEIIIDSVYVDIQRRLKLGVSWDKLGYLNLESTGWTKEEEYVDEIKDQFLKHNQGEIFRFENPKENYGVIIIKTDKEKYFKRNKIVLAVKLLPK